MRNLIILGLAAHVAANVATMSLFAADDIFNNSRASVVHYDDVQKLTTVEIVPKEIPIAQGMHFELPKAITVTQGASTFSAHYEYTEDSKAAQEDGHRAESVEVNLHCHLGLSSMATCNGKGATHRYLDSPSTIASVDNGDNAPQTYDLVKSPCVITLTAGLEKLPASASPSPSQTAPPSTRTSSESTGNKESSTAGSTSASAPPSTGTSATKSGNAGALPTQNAAMAGLAAMVGAMVF